MKHGGKEKIRFWRKLMKKKVLSILVDNTSGVLSRISGLFSRRGYNIDSLTVGETENPKYSRMTVVVRGDDHILDQIEKQLAKLEDVRCVKELKSGHSVCRELVLITVGVQASNRPEIIKLLDGYEIKELVRTGIAGLSRGAEVMLDEFD